MSVNDDLQALTTSIGMHCVAGFVEETLNGLEVVLNPTEMTTDVSVALKNDSPDEHRRVIEEYLKVEELFFDEVVLTLHFVDKIDSALAARRTAPVFSLA